VPKTVRAKHDNSLPHIADNPAAQSAMDLETLLLRALCQAPASAARDELLASLQRHQWRGSEHGLIFQTMAELSQCSGDELRRALPAHVARAGFPDTDVNLFFAPLQWSGNSLLSFAGELCRVLTTGAKTDQKSKLEVGGVTNPELAGH
jgi:hypothetical protein